MAVEYSATNRLIDMTVPLAKVRPSTFNPRRRFDEAQLQELADSIREHGLLEPIVVRPVNLGVAIDTGKTWEIVAGERRYRACTMAGLTEIPVRVHTALSDEAALKLAIIENVQRVDLDPVEEAEGYRALAALGMKQREIAESVHRSQPAVANAMRLLDLPADVQERISRGELTASHGVALASWKQLPRVASRLAALAVACNWTSKETEKPFDLNNSPIWNLKADGFLRDMYDAVFDRNRCQACPFEAFRNPGGAGHGYCFKPEHFDELNTAAKAQRDEQSKRLLEAKRQSAAIEGKELFQLSGMSLDLYARLENADEVPAGCRPDCEHRTQAIDRYGSVITICLDPKCHNRLKMAATRSDNKAGRELMKALLQDLEERIDAITEIGPREMAVVGAAILANEWRLRHYLREACERQGRGAIWSALNEPGWQSSSRYDKSVEAGPLAIAKIVVEAVCRMELVERYQERRKSDSATADWYLRGEAPVKAAASAEATICPTAGLPCDPATCVQDCPKADAAQKAATGKDMIRPINGPGPCITDCDRLCALRTGNEHDGYPAYCLGYSAADDTAPWEGAAIAGGEEGRN